MNKRIISLFLVLMMVSSMIFPICAGYIYPGKFKDYDNSYKLEWFDKDKWEIVSGVKEIVMRNMGSSNLMYVTSDKQGEAMRIAYVIEDGIDLSAYNEIVVGMILNNSKDCTYTITYYYDGGSYSDKVTSDKGTKNTLHFMLPSENSDSITRVEFEVSNPVSIPNYFAIESFYADSNRTYSYAEKFQSRRVSVTEGNAKYYDDHIEIIPNENVAYLDCELIKDYNSGSAVAVIEIKSSFSGMMTVENVSTGKTSTTSLYVGTVKYNIMISELEKKLKVGFLGGDNSGEALIELLSLQIIPVAKDETESIGTVESCLFDNGKLTVKGNIDSSVAVKYINSSLALFRVPFNYSNENYELGEPEIEMSISTAFAIETAVKYDYTRYKYIVAIKTKDEVIPLTDPVYAFPKKTAPVTNQECHKGLHNAKSTAVFESEAEDVVIDVYVNHLFASSGTVSAIRFAYRDNVYYINSSYVNELSSKVDFFTSIGSKVYFRVLSDEEGAFDFSLTQDYSVDLMRASAAYIGSHYEKIAGVIILSEFNYNESQSDRIKEASDLLGLFASSLKSVNNTMELYVSINRNNGYIATVLSAYNKNNGIDNVGVFYDVQDFSDCVVNLRALCDSAILYGNAFEKTMILWRAKKDSITTDAYKQIYENAIQNSVSSVILSANDNITTNDICNVFEGLYEKENVRYQFDAFKTETEYRGSYDLWDFTQSYNTFGWFAGGYCSSPETTKSVFNNSRVMKSDITPTRDDEGILVGWFNDVTNLSIADVLKVDLAVKIDAHRDVSIRVVLGGNGSKAEYVTTAKNGEHSIYLDINSYTQANKVEYIAIIINSEIESTLEVSRVSVLSHALADDELKFASGKNDDYFQDKSTLYVFIGAFVSSTIVAFIALSKKKTTKHNNDKKN